MFIIGAALLLPLLSKVRSSSQAFQCLSNLRRMQVAWSTYSADHMGVICPTAGTAHPNSPQWVHGRMDIPIESTNTNHIQRGLLWPYARSVALYKCPADIKRVSNGAATVRSISMNAWMNPVSTLYQNGLSAPARVFRRESDLEGGFSPAQWWVLMDENHNTINDGWFCVSASQSGANAFTWIDIPASYHNQSGGISFADGRAEMKRWRDRAVLNATAVFIRADASQSPAYGDLSWLRERSTVAP
ncbi:MAG TPA: hypothetical protein VEH04_19930 [Verrucomicrobiae bacterium]|nr:hypothetical protein [Verrucomicrobiae bacterium]